MVEADREGRKPLISGNWKMYLNHFEATALVQKLVYELTSADYAAVDVSIHPSFTNLRTVQTYFLAEKDPVPIAIGAQNCHWEEKGPFTGEVSGIPNVASCSGRPTRWSTARSGPSSGGT